MGTQKPGRRHMQNIQRASRQRDPALGNIQRLAVQRGLILNLALQKSVPHIALDLT